MLQQFINQTRNFLNHSDITIHNLKVTEVNINNQGEIQFFMSTADEFGLAKIADNVLFHTLVFFSLADAQVDKMLPQLEGSSFRKRYKNLPVRNDNEIIFKESYRVLKIIRNAATHSKSNINYRNNKLFIQYLYDGTTFHLEISKLGLELIYTYLLEAYVPNHYPKLYKESVLRTLYVDLLNEIGVLRDEFGSVPLAISSGFRLSKRDRLRVLNAKVSKDIKSLNISFNKVKSKLHLTQSSLDFFVELNGNHYLFPEEILNKNHSILLSEISVFKFK